MKVYYSCPPPTNILAYVPRATLSPTLLTVFWNMEDTEMGFSESGPVSSRRSLTGVSPLQEMSESAATNSSGPTDDQR